MILHLTNGLSTEKNLTSPTMGFRLEGLTLECHDMRQLLRMSNEELREQLSILYTRFAPPLQKADHAQN